MTSSVPTRGGVTAGADEIVDLSVLSANLECMSEMCCMRLAGNTGRENYAKNRHLRTIAHITVSG